MGVQLSETGEGKRATRRSRNVKIAAIAVIVIAALAAVAVYDVNGSLDLRDREVRLVPTGSMDGEPQPYDIPTIPTDSLISIKHVDSGSVYSEVSVGDVIAYTNASGMVIVHRVISIDEAADEIITKGDAVSSEDAPISADAVIGEVVGVSHVMGEIVSFVKESPILMIGMIAIILVMLSTIPEIVKIVKKKDE